MLLSVIDLNQRWLCNFFWKHEWRR